MKRHLRTLSLALCGAGLLAACGPSGEAPPTLSGGTKSGCLSRAYPQIGGPIELTTHTGERVTEEAFKGRPSLVYFGFTYCPDVCPMTLVNVQRAYEKLPEGVTPPQTLLISVDPERDTPEALAAYITAPRFPEGLVGLTGSPEDIEAATDAFKVYYARVDQPDSQSDYLMDHSSFLYLMDEDWKIKTFFNHEDTDDTIAACLAEVLQEE